MAPAVAAGLYSSRDQVIVATESTFKSIVMDTEHPVAVEFFAPWCGHCQQLAPEYIKAAAKLQGLAKLVAVDCDDRTNAGLCSRFDIKGFPTVKVFPGGLKSIPTEYMGERTAKAIVDFMINQMTSRHVTQIGTSGSKFTKIETFVNKNGKLPRVLLVTSKTATAPLYKGLSVEYKDRVLFAEAKGANAKLAESLTTKVPTLLVWPADKTELEAFEEYQGELKQKPLKEFIEKYAPPPPKGKKPAKKPAKKPDAKPASSEKPKQTPDSETKIKMPKPESEPEAFDETINEIRSQEDLDALCLDKAGVCVVSFIPLEPEFPQSVYAHADALETLKESKRAAHSSDKAAAGIPFTFVWVNPVEHGSKLIRDFDVSDMYPSMVAINARKRVYRPLRTAFDKASIASFLDDLVSGHGRSMQYSFKPQLDKPAKPRVEPAATPSVRDEL